MAWVGLETPAAALALLRRLETATGDAVESFEIVPQHIQDDLVNGFTAPVTALAVDIAKTRTEIEYSPRQPDPVLSAARTFAAHLAAAGVVVEGEPARGVAPAGALELAAVRSAPMVEVVVSSTRRSGRLYFW